MSRGRFFWPVIAIPAPDGCSATLAVRNHDESFRVKGRDSKGNTLKGKSKGNKYGKRGKNKGRKGKSLEPNVDCVVKVTGRKIVLKLMSTCLKPNAV